MVQPVVAIVIVPAEGDRFPVAPTVKAPFIVKPEPVVVVPFIVIPVKVSVPEFVIEVAVVSKVIVPPVGAKVLPVDTVKALLIV